MLRPYCCLGQIYSNWSFHFSNHGHTWVIQRLNYVVPQSNYYLGTYLKTFKLQILGLHFYELTQSKLLKSEMSFALIKTYKLRYETS